MNCPKCGTSVEADQQFCRTCGLALMEDAPRRIRPQMVMLIIFAVIFLGIVAGILGDMAGIRWVKFTGVIVAIAGMFSIAAASLLFEMRNPRRRTTQPPTQTTVERADTTNKLLPIGQNDYVPSVTENTTHLLDPVEAKTDNATHR